jgi:hypothetical protein
MKITQIKLNAEWKIIFQEFWNNTPKNKRKTIKQINSIRLQAKIYNQLYN